MNSEERKAFVTAAEQLEPIKFLGQNPIGGFLFCNHDPLHRVLFHTLNLAVVFYGRRIQITGDGLNPCWHAGYNDAIGDKKCKPRTDVSDGAPRTLSDDERNLYYYGYMKGLMME